MQIDWKSIGNRSLGRTERETRPDVDPRISKRIRNVLSTKVNFTSFTNRKTVLPQQVHTGKTEGAEDLDPVSTPYREDDKKLVSQVLKIIRPLFYCSYNCFPTAPRPFLSQLPAVSSCRTSPSYLIRRRKAPQVLLS